MGCCPDKRMPGLAEQAGNVVKAAGRVAAAMAQGEPVQATPETVARRMRACLACERAISRPSRINPGKIYHRCAECGCWLDGEGPFSKAKLATETCPLGKWEGA